MSAAGRAMSPRDAFRGLEPFFESVRRVIVVLAFVSGASVLGMMGITVADVCLRLFRRGIVGAYDVVRICGLVSIACALPYLTAVKGHIAIEFFYQSFSRTGRVLLDSIFRVVALALFGFLAVRSVLYGLSLRAAGLQMPTLRVPVFWMPLLVSFSCLLIFVVVAYHLLHPGREMIKP